MLRISPSALLSTPFRLRTEPNSGGTCPILHRQLHKYSALQITTLKQRLSSSFVLMHNTVGPGWVTFPPSLFPRLRTSANAPSESRFSLPSSNAAATPGPHFQVGKVIRNWLQHQHTTVSRLVQYVSAFLTMCSQECIEIMGNILLALTTRRPIPPTEC